MNFLKSIRINLTSVLNEGRSNEVFQIPIGIVVAKSVNEVILFRSEMILFHSYQSTSR